MKRTRSQALQHKSREHAQVRSETRNTVPQRHFDLQLIQRLDEMNSGHLSYLVEFQSHFGREMQNVAAEIKLLEKDSLSICPLDLPILAPEAKSYMEVR